MIDAAGLLEVYDWGSGPSAFRLGVRSARLLYAAAGVRGHAGELWAPRRFVWVVELIYGIL